MNNIKTAALMAGLTALLIVIGTLVAGRVGMIFAFGLAAIMNFSAYWFSDQIVLSMYQAQPLQESHAVYQIIANLAQKGGVPMPVCYVINDPTPNAFATGRNPQHASIAVTTGLLSVLNQQELTGVLAHEMAHVIHRDTLISVLSATIAGAISSVANMFMWLSMFGGRHHDQEGSVNPLVGIAMMIFAPMAASLIQMAVSRSREYEADRGGALLCGEPLWLANALLKIEAVAKQNTFEAAEHHPATAHLFIINPLRNAKLAELFSTHPLTSERVRRLREMNV